MARGTPAQVGDERWSKNGYLYRRLPNRWELVSRIIAEEKLGRSLSANEYVSYKDGDKTNLDPDNILIHVRGRSSLRRRLATVEDQIRELTAVADELRKRLEIQEGL